ncbi:MAG: 2Fe-2S iron-sulfur cluster-binding protein, partial [Coriobacteriia bacterium]
MPKVTFTPDGTAVTVAPGENLLRAAMLADVAVSASCGGDGTCGKCRMVVEQGTVDTTVTAKLTAEEIERGYVLACLSTVTDDVTVHVPLESRPGKAPVRGGSSRQPNVVLSPEDRAVRVPRQASPPPVAKRLLRMNAPDLTDNINDASRVKQTLKRVHGIREATISLPALRELPQAARDGEWVVTAFA